MFQRLGRALKRVFKRQAKIKKLSDLDRELVMSLKTSKIPTWSQLKKITALLSVGEKKIILSLIILIALTIAYGGYQFYQTQIIIVPTANGSWSEALIGQPKFINPILAQTNDTDLDITRLVYSGLLKYNEHLELVTDLAENYFINEDQTKYTFVLKDGLVWQDDTPLTIDDVIFTFQSIQDADWQSPLFISFKGVAIDKIDERTIVFNLTKPFAPFISLLTTGILPKHIWQNIPPTSAKLAEFNLKPIGNGQWQFKEFTKDKNGNIHSYSLAPNPRYFATKPFLSEIIFKFYPDFETAISALNDRQVMGLSFLPNELKPLITEPPKYNYNKIELPQYNALFFNQKNNTALKSLAVRQALAHAIDKNSLIKNALQGEGKIIESPILNNDSAFVAELKKYDYDPSISQKLLTENGWELITEEDGQKKWQKEDATLAVTITTVNHPENTKVGAELKSAFEAIGVITDLKIVEALDIQNDIIKNRNFEILLYGEIVGGDPDPFPFWHSSQAEYPGLNLSQFKEARTDILLEEARQTHDKNIRKTNYQSFQKIIAENVPAIFLYSPTYTYIQNKRLKGFDIKDLIIPADRFNNIANWYTQTKRILK